MHVLEPPAVRAARSEREPAAADTAGPRRDFAEWLRDPAEQAPGHAPHGATDADAVSAAARAGQGVHVQGFATLGVLYGWRLEAQAGLSQISTQAGARGWLWQHADAADTRVAAARYGGIGAWRQAMVDGAAQALPPDNGGTNPAGAQLLPLSSAEQGRAAMRMASAGAILSSWPERYLRVLPHPDGQGTTLWLRDYSLSAEQIQSCVRAWAGTRHAQGVTTRIVINGVEAWRAPDPSFSENT